MCLSLGDYDMPTDASTFYFTQGVLGVTVVILAIALYRIYTTLSAKLELKEKEKVAILETWRLETKQDGQAAIDVLRGNSQSILYLADKIQVGKTDNRGKQL